MYDKILVRYGEISLKGSNRWVFEKQLLDNIRGALADLGPHKISTTYSRIFIDLENDWEEVSQRLQKVFGLVSFSPVISAPLDLETIKQKAMLVFEDTPGNTFKVQSRRSNKLFAYDSMQLNTLVGEYLFESSGMPVDVHNPEKVINIEVRDEAAYIFAKSAAGPGGLPVGTNGKGVLMLSGGIDSPVAGWLAMKRGLKITALHFYSFPFTSERSKEKVLDLCQVLTQYCGSIRLVVAPFTEIQTVIRQKCPQELYVTLMRRMMFRIAQAVCQQEKAEAILTGESLGQVASQTLQSINVISRVVNLPVLRPVITYDKLEIIEIAQKINTFDISIRPFEDCCTVFVPKHPAIRPKLDKTEQAEKALDIPALLEQCLSNLEIIEFSADSTK